MLCGCTYLLQLFGDVGRVFPQFSSEALSQHQGVEHSRETCLGSVAQKLCQACSASKYNQRLDKYQFKQSVHCLFVIPDFSNVHLLMRIPFLKILTVSCVSPNSWIEMEPN